MTTSSATPQDSSRRLSSGFSSTPEYSVAPNPMNTSAKVPRNSAANRVNGAAGGVSISVSSRSAATVSVWLVMRGSCPEEAVHSSSLAEKAERLLRAGRVPSIQDDVLSLLREPGQVLPHHLDALCAVPSPLLQLLDHSDRFPSAVRPGRIAREALIGDVRVVLQLTYRVHDVDALATLALGELGAPCGRGQRLGDVDVVQRSIRSVVRRMPESEQVPGAQVGLGAVQVDTRFEHLEGCRVGHCPLTS